MSAGGRRDGQKPRNYRQLKASRPQSRSAAGGGSGGSGKNRGGCDARKNYRRKMPKSLIATDNKSTDPTSTPTSVQLPADFKAPKLVVNPQYMPVSKKTDTSEISKKQAASEDSKPTTGDSTDETTTNPLHVPTDHLPSSNNSNYKPSVNKPAGYNKYRATNRATPALTTTKSKPPKRCKCLMLILFVALAVLVIAAVAAIVGSLWASKDTSIPTTERPAA